MPTSSVAMAVRGGRPVSAKMMGSAGVQLASAPPAARADRGRGRGQPPSGSMSFSDPPVEAPVSQRGDVSKDSMGAQLDRELEAIQRRPTTTQPTDPSSSYAPFVQPPPTPPPQPPPPRKSAAEQQRKKIREFEAMVVKKLIDRTPFGPDDQVYRQLIKAFAFYDAGKDGVVTLDEFTKALARFGCVASLPPSDANKVLVAGLFRKYAGEGAAELDYKLFTHHLLCESGVRVPLREAMVREEAAKLTDWQYTTAVQQSLAKRNLDRSDPEKDAGVQMYPAARGAFVTPSAAARAVEEGQAYRIPPRNSVGLGAALRGRLEGGKAGFKEFKRLEAEAYREAAEARALHDRNVSEAIERRRRSEGEAQREALAQWTYTREQTERMRGLAPGQYEAELRRRRALNR